MKNILKNKILLVVLLITFFVRVWNVGNVGNGLLGDEAALGYNAYSIFKNGTDEYGVKYPLYFESIGDYKYPVYIYLTTPFVGLFGLNIFSTRLLSVILGTFVIFVIYKLILKITQQEMLANLAAFVMAISPWHIFFSRSASESNIGLFFATLSIYSFVCFMLSNNKNRNRYVIFSLLAFVMAIFSYPAYRIFLPIFYFAYISYSVLCEKQANKLKVIIFGLIVVSITAISFISPLSRARISSLRGDMSLLTDSKEELIFADGISSPGKTFFTRLYHNKYVLYSQNILASYLKQFDLTFWFINGDYSRPYFNVPNMGLMYIVEIPLILIGAIYLYNSNKNLFAIAGLWLLSGLIPSSLANELPNSVRLLAALPGFVIFIASGLYAVISAKYLYRKTALFLVCLMYVIQMSYFYHQYTNHFPITGSKARDYDMYLLVDRISVLQANYANVVMGDDPYIFFLFYGKVNPSDFYNNTKLGARIIGSWERVDKWNKFTFKMPYDCPKVGKLNTLYVCRGSEVPQNARVVDVIRYKDKLPAFVLIEFFPVSEIDSSKNVLPSELKYMVDRDERNEGLIPASDQRLW